MKYLCDFIMFPSLVLWSSDILREFNPSVTGFSKGICNETSPNAFLNQAVPGGKSGSVIYITSSTLNKTILKRQLQNFPPQRYAAASAHPCGHNEE